MQVTFLDFWTAILAAVADFLMTEPVIYFTALVILLFVGYLVKRLIM